MKVPKQHILIKAREKPPLESGHTQTKMQSPVSWFFFPHHKWKIRLEKWGKLMKSK